MGGDPAEAATTEPLAGTKYRVLRKLGKGGMGDVYEVEHVELGRRLVVKIMREALANDPRYLERFRIEAQALAALQHSNVVQVMDFGRTSSGCPYFVMERLVGMTISERLRARGTPTIAEALDWMIQALQGLDAAHRSGIVHRDLKPGNLFLAQDEHGTITVKLIDFGIAKLVDPAKTNILPSAFATEKGVFIGTPHYVSPEQGLGKRVDERSDIYCIGLVLYRLLACRGPFDHVGKDVKLIAAHIARNPEPPSTYAAKQLPAGLDAIVLKALEKDPKHRYQSANEMAEALRAMRVRYRNAEAPTTLNVSNVTALDRGTEARGAVDPREHTLPIAAPPEREAKFQAVRVTTEKTSAEEASDTVVDPASFATDSYTVPRPLTAHEATLILEDDTFDPFADAGTTHTAVPVGAAAKQSMRPSRSTFRLVAIMVVSAIITAIVATLVLEFVLR